MRSFANYDFNGALTVPSPPNWVAVADGTQTVRFIDPTDAARLAAADTVSVDTPALSNGCFDGIRMDAYGVRHNLIDTNTTPAFTSSGPKTTTTVSGAGIHYVKMKRIVSGCVAPLQQFRRVPIRRRRRARVHSLHRTRGHRAR